MSHSINPNSSASGILFVVIDRQFYLHKTPYKSWKYCPNVRHDQRLWWPSVWLKNERLSISSFKEDLYKFINIRSYNINFSKHIVRTITEHTTTILWSMSSKNFMSRLSEKQINLKLFDANKLIDDVALNKVNN